MADAPVPDMSAADGRYARQVAFPGIGAAGQERLGAAVVTVIGCGALGSASVNMLARGGVGEIRIIDRDVVELSNLQRQVLFEERDAADATPKAVAAAAAVARINSGIRAAPLVANVTAGNVLELLAGSSIVIDGTDNLETRLLLNDACMRMGLPWVYGGVAGSTGLAMAIVPRRTACFRCLYPHAPSVTRLDTAATAGILAAVVATVAAFQCTQAVKLLVNDESDTAGRLLTVDVWSCDYEALHEIPRQAACPCCVGGVYEYLDAGAGSPADPAGARSPDARRAGA